MLRRRAIEILTFLLAFSLELRVVKAAETVKERFGLPVALRILDEPRGCLAAHSQTCAVKTGENEKFILRVRDAEVVMDRSTAIIVTKTDIALVEGTVWVTAVEPFKVRTEYGEAEAEHGEFWISRSLKRMTASAISVPVILTPRGSSELLSVSPGLQNYMSGVQKDGSAETGLPIAISFTEHIARWARLFDGTKSQFETEVAAFHSTWVEASKQAAELHQSMLNRRVASVRAEHERVQERRAKVEQENREMRNLFRKKTLEGL